MRPGGVRSVAAESLLLKHQLIILNRSQKRAPNLTPWDRLLIGFTAGFVCPKRLSKIAVSPKAQTCLRFHQALIRLKYFLLYSPRKHRRPGPKGPPKDVIAAVVEMKRRNPRMGCRKIAEQIAHAFGVEIDKDVVRRILVNHYHPDPRNDGPSWLATIGHIKDSLWSMDLFRCESLLLKSFWVLLVMDVFTRRIVGIGVEPADIDGITVCRMFNHAIAGQRPPKYLSTDNDPLFRCHRWRANLRILDIEEIKTVPFVPRSHPFVERLIRTFRQEILDQLLFWNGRDLEQKLVSYKDYYNGHRCHTGLAGAVPNERSGEPIHPVTNLASYRWMQHCNGLFQTPIAA